MTCFYFWFILSLQILLHLPDQEFLEISDKLVIHTFHSFFSESGWLFEHFLVLLFMTQEAKGTWKFLIFFCFINPCGLRHTSQDQIKLQTKSCSLCFRVRIQSAASRHSKNSLKSRALEAPCAHVLSEHPFPENPRALLTAPLYWGFQLSVLLNISTSE